MTPTQTHAALLSEEELVTCIVVAGCLGKVKMSYESGPFAIDRPTLNASRLYNAIEQALLAKLQPAQEPAQAGELPDERDALGHLVRIVEKFLIPCFKKLDSEGIKSGQHDRDELYAAHAYARAALAARKPLSVGDVHTLIGEAATQSMNGKTDMPNYFIDLAVRIAESIGDPEVIKRAKALQERGINGLEVKPLASYKMQQHKHTCAIYKTDESEMNWPYSCDCGYEAERANARR